MSNDKNPKRRALHFETLDEIVAEAERLDGVAYARVKKWSLGQNTEHVAKMMEGSLDGFGFRLPVVFRWVARLFKDRVLEGPMPAGIKGGASKKFRPFLASDDVTDGAGIERLRRAVHRLKTEPQREPSPLLGELTREEWDRFHRTHAELHLGHLVPDAEAAEGSRVEPRG